MMMNLNQDLLITFKTAIDTGSFSATARKLGKAPSAISMSISQLEDELNLVLFDRSKREPVPTAAALSLYQSTIQTLSSMQQWQNHALQLSNYIEPMLSIAFATELESLKWTHIFAELAERFPLLKLEILTLPQQEALESVLSGRVNFAILLERQSLSDQEQFIGIGKEKMLAVAAKGHPLFCSKVTYNDLLQHRQILFHQRETRSSSVLQLSYHHWQTDNQYYAKDIIKAGLAWGFLPESNITQELSEQSLAILDICDFSPSIELYVDLVWGREQTQGQASQYFIDIVRETWSP